MRQVTDTIGSGGRRVGRQGTLPPIICHQGNVSAATKDSAPAPVLPSQSNIASSTIAVTILEGTIALTCCLPACTCRKSDRIDGRV
jgi:hypothetical protein